MRFYSPKLSVAELLWILAKECEPSVLQTETKVVGRGET